MNPTTKWLPETPNGWSSNGERLFKMWIKSLLDKCLTKRETWSRPRGEVKRNPGPSLAVATLTTPATPQGPNSCLNPICSSAHLFYSIDTSFNFVLQHSPTVYYSNFLCSNNSSHLIRSHFNSIRMKTALEFHLIQLPVFIFLFHLIIFFWPIRLYWPSKNSLTFRFSASNADSNVTSSFIASHFRFQAGSFHWEIFHFISFHFFPLQLTETRSQLNSRTAPFSICSRVASKPENVKATVEHNRHSKSKSPPPPDSTPLPPWATVINTVIIDLNAQRKQQFLIASMDSIDRYFKKKEPLNSGRWSNIHQRQDEMK